MMEVLVEEERRVEVSLAMRPRPLWLIADETEVTNSANVEVTDHDADAASKQGVGANVKDKDLLAGNEKSVNNVATLSAGESSSPAEVPQHKAKHEAEGSHFPTADAGDHSPSAKQAAHSAKHGADWFNAPAVEPGERSLSAETAGHEAQQHGKAVDAATASPGQGFPSAKPAGHRAQHAVNGLDAPASNPDEASVVSAELACNAARHGVDGWLKVTLAAECESLAIRLVDKTDHVFEGVLQAECAVGRQDIRDAFEGVCKGFIRIRLDKLKVLGVGFQVKLQPCAAAAPAVLSLEEQLCALDSKVEALKQALQQASRPFVYEVPLKELRGYGWAVDAATKYLPDGSVPDDDTYWRGYFNGKVRVLLICGRVLLEGQVSGIGPGMRKHSEHPLGATPYAEVAFRVFRLPPNCRPKAPQSFSRRLLDIGKTSSEYIGGIAKGVIDYYPLRRLDVLPDGFVVLVTCLYNVRNSVGRVRPTRWTISFKHVDFFLE
eukprot:g35903.t1